MKCFDTHLLIGGIRGEAETGQEDMVLRAQKYIALLDSKKEKIMIPAPVLSEFLVGSGTPKNRKAELAAATGKHFRIYPLDTPAAEKAAEIQEMDLVRSLVKDGADRDKIKVDAMIVAIAIVRKAELYSTRL